MQLSKEEVVPLVEYLHWPLKTNNRIITLSSRPEDKLILDKMQLSTHQNLNKIEMKKVNLKEMLMMRNLQIHSQMTEKVAPKIDFYQQATDYTWEAQWMILLRETN